MLLCKLASLYRHVVADGKRAERKASQWVEDVSLPNNVSPMCHPPHLPQEARERLQREHAALSAERSKLEAAASEISTRVAALDRRERAVEGSEATWSERLAQAEAKQQVCMGGAWGPGVMGLCTLFSCRCLTRDTKAARFACYGAVLLLQAAADAALRASKEQHALEIREAQLKEREAAVGELKSSLATRCVVVGGVLLGC